MHQDPPDRAAHPARARALGALVAVGIGFCAAERAAIGLEAPIASAAWFGAALLAGAGALATRGRVCAVLMLVMAAMLAGGWFTVRLLERPAGRLVLPPGPGDVLVHLEAMVVEGAGDAESPRGAMGAFAVGEARKRFVVSVRRVEEGGVWRRATGRVVVYIPGEVDAPTGRRIALTGRGQGPGPPTNPGQPDPRLWAAQDGISGSLTVPSGDLVTSAAGPPELLDPVLASMLRGRDWLSARVRAGLEHIGDTRARALTASLMLGAREEEGRAISTSFQRLGLAHVLAISGVHMAMLAWATLLVVRLAGDFGALEPILAAGAVGAYLVVAPAEAPIVRSGIMVLALLLGDALGRRYDGVVVLAWTAVALLAWRPLDLHALGFQLSFGVTGVLLGAGLTFHTRLWGGPRPLLGPGLDRPWWARVLEGVKRSISTSVLAWATASPWIAARVGLLSPLAVFSSLVVALPISALMLLGFVAMLIGAIVPGGGAAWAVCEPAARAALACVDRLDTLPGSSMATGSIPLAWGAAAGLGVLWLLTRARARSPRTWTVVLLLGAWLLASATLLRGPGRNVVLRLDALEVGDATCILIRSGDAAMLWDCGAAWSGAGETRIPAAALTLGTHPVRTAVVTHANLDHFNALPDTAWRLGVRELLVGAPLLERSRREPRGATAAMLDLLRDQGVRITRIGAGDRVRIGEATVEFIGPRGDTGRWSANEQSLVAMMTVPTLDGDRRVLLTGDVAARGIAGLFGHMAEHPTPLHADVIEAPHHGAFRRESAALVEAVRPRIIVQSTGRGRVGMSRATDPRWAESIGDARWLSTATRGAVWVEIRRDGSVRSGWLDGE